MTTTAWIIVGGFVWVLVLLYRISNDLNRAAKSLSNLAGLGIVVPRLEEIHHSLKSARYHLWRINWRMEERWPTELESEEQRRRKAEVEAKFDAAVSRAEEWLKHNPGGPLPEDLKIPGIAIEALLELKARRAQPEGGEPEGPESAG